MKLLIALLLTAFLISSYGQNLGPNPGVIQEENVGEFKLSVYLPPGYSANEKYNVLYVNDGQTIFGPGGLNLDGTANELFSKKLIEPIIIVGIHSGKNRTSYYIPYMDESAKIDFGDYQALASGYTKKIINTIIPFIEKKYSTLPNRGIAGYSFGGLQATWAALNFPDVFSFSGAFSPSYWVADFKIFKEGGKAQTNQVYYFDVGTGEWNYYVPILLKFNLPILEKAFYFEDHGATHTIMDWRNRSNNVLILFAGKTDFKNYTWEIVTEVIKSQHTNKFYLRLNPVITYTNGLRCSISYAATFELNNPEDGTVNKDGSFVFKTQNDLHVRVLYNGETRDITINQREIEKLKSRF